MDIKEYKEKIFKSAEIAVNELIKVMEDPIITGDKGEDLSADKLKNAAMSKKLSVFDALEIMARIDEEKKILQAAEEELNGRSVKKEEAPKISSFAEQYADKKKKK